ncbi:hypothetical protein [Elongatibacter sediminis]|uniref:PIN domain-containing protein n=1 Tax=Elongatibacter sediminis TaxID=3119006 RepID=A0AAW9RBX3_9GAMM
MSASPVYLVDASVYIFRAWFSMPDAFNNARGEPTNAVYGFTGFLCSLLEQTSASHVGVAFDESLTTSYRNEIYPEYKANRDPAPDTGCEAVPERGGLFAASQCDTDGNLGGLANGGTPLPDLRELAAF